MLKEYPVYQKACVLLIILGLTQSKGPGIVLVLPDLLGITTLIKIHMSLVSIPDTEVALHLLLPVVEAAYVEHGQPPENMLLSSP